MRPHSLGLIGAGGRGIGMAGFALNYHGRAKIVAVADIDDGRIKLSQQKFNLSPNHCYKDYRKLLSSGIKLDGVFIATPAYSHAEIACACLEAGIAVFLEKPMAVSIEDAAKIAKTAKKTGTRIQVGFNLRYAPFFVKLKEIVASGKIGKILSLEWKEVISPHHWASYCRQPSYTKRNIIGSWLLEKCCHDLDLINWITESKCIRVVSFGSRSCFNRRPDLPQHCTDGCPIETKCIFSTFKLYSEIVLYHPELKGKTVAQLPKWTTQCVYNTESDLVDHQSSILEYADGVTACFSLMPLSHLESRLVYICGTEATLIGCDAKNEIHVYPHQSQKEIICDPELATEGHGGADPLIVLAFLDWLDNLEEQPKTTAKEGLESMIVGCGIDLALRKRRVVDLNTYRKEFK